MTTLQATTSSAKFAYYSYIQSYIPPWIFCTVILCVYPETTKSSKPWKIKFSVAFGTEREVHGEKGNIFKMSCTSAYCKMPCKHVLTVMIHKVDCHASNPRKRSLPTISDSSEEPGTRKRKRNRKEYQKAYRANPVNKARKAVLMRGYYNDPAKKAMRKAWRKRYHSRPDVKAKRQAYQKKFYRNVPRKAKMDQPKRVYIGNSQNSFGQVLIVDWCCAVVC